MNGKKRRFNLDAIQYESQRAMSKYGMLVISGIEISKNYFSSDRSAHILLLDLKDCISASWDYEKIFLEAKKQDALIVACHPHTMSDMSKHTYYPWNNRERYAKYIDA